MEKDFFHWHHTKSKIETNARKYFYEREIWWCKLGVNVGFEQDGKGKNFARPVLVFKKFNNEIFWAIPLSTKQKVGKYYSNIYLEDTLPRVVILSQLRLIDAKRFLGRIGTITKENHDDIKRALINLFHS